MTQARSRSLRLLGGVPPARIHGQDGLELVANVGISMVAGFAAVAAYTGWTHGVEHLPVFLRELAVPWFSETPYLAISKLRSCHRHA